MSTIAISSIKLLFYNLDLSPFDYRIWGVMLDRVIRRQFEIWPNLRHLDWTVAKHCGCCY